MGEWSPECVRCRWVGGADRPRSAPLPRDEPQRVAQVDHHVHDRRCATASGSREVTYFGLPVARWEYRLETEGDAVRLVEAVDDRRGRSARCRR